MNYFLRFKGGLATSFAVALFVGASFLGIVGLLLTSDPGGIRPASAQQFGPIYCSQMATSAANFTTKVGIVPTPGVASSRIFICGMTASAVAASIVTFQYGTGTACATGSTAIGPTIQLNDKTTYDDGSGVFRGFLVPAGQGFCATASAAANLSVYYNIQ